MLVHHHINQIPIIDNAVITIGAFDGVHLGHQKIIEQLKKEASDIDGKSVVITFHPHPRTILHSNESAIYTLNTLEEKIELLEKMDIDHVVIIPFTKEFAQQPAVDYIEFFLVHTFQPNTIVIGYDHKFGNNREGDYNLLKSLASKYNYVVKEIPEQVIQEIAISSTHIRKALLTCNVEKATTLLGYPYFFEGLVVEGNKKGRTIGFPTANLAIEDEKKLIPADGVYAIECSIFNVQYSNSNTLKGMMNIGLRPTVNGKQRTIEVHLFDFNENIYGKKVRICIHHFLRAEKKFESLDVLKKQLFIDQEYAITCLNDLPTLL